VCGVGPIRNLKGGWGSEGRSSELAFDWKNFASIHPEVVCPKPSPGVPGVGPPSEKAAIMEPSGAAAARRRGGSRHPRRALHTLLPLLLIPAAPASVLRPSDSTRIIGGTEDAARRYPYAVSLHYAGEAFCAGALIAPDVVLSAGHCNGQSLKEGLSYNVMVGRHDLDLYWTGESIRLREEFRHPEYNEENVDNDFNVVVLSESASDSVPIIRLNDDPFIPYAPPSGRGDGDELTVMGWGDTTRSEAITTPSDVLMSTTVKAMSNEECERSEGNVDLGGKVMFTSLSGGITDNMLCAWASGTDACQGDSGGPLVRKGQDPSGADDRLVGITSWGLSCADDNFPGVYSRVSSQYDWIRSKICEHSKSPPGYLECIPRSPLSGNIFTDDLAVTTTTPPQSPPTSAPTRSPLPSGLERIRIEIELDDYPSHTGWSLQSTNDGGTSPGEIIFEMPIGAYDETDRGLRGVYEFEIESESFYTITISDEAADGFDGTLTAYRDGVPSSSNRLVYEPGFTSVSGSSVTHAFYAGDDPPAYLTLVFDFDYYAHEVAWQVEDEGSGTIMGLVWFDTYEAGTDGISVVMPVYGTEWGDREYSLTLWDAAADGICCSQSSGRGSYSLYVGDASEPDNLVRTGGDYGSGETFLFEVMGDPTYPPTMSPTELPQTLAPTTSRVSPAPTTYVPPSAATYEPTSPELESFFDPPTDVDQVIAAATDEDAEEDWTPSSRGTRGPAIAALLGLPLLLLGGII